MKNWIRVFLIGVFVIVTGFVALPTDIKQHIPFETVRNYLLTKDIHYGLDLAGGSQLDFIIDLTRVREKIAAGADITEDEIVNGVKATLERRIDPDGTRELNVYTADFKEEKHIFVELTADIDTPETREKLKKHIDLQFKELTSEANDSEKNAAKQGAEEAFALLQEKTELSEIETVLNERKDKMFQATLEEQQKKFRDEFPEGVSEKIWDLEPGNFAPEVLESGLRYSYDQGTGQFVQIEGYSLYQVGEKEEVEREKTEPGEDFDVLAQEIFPEEAIQEYSIIELPEDIQKNILANIEAGEISEVLEENENYVIYKRLEATEEELGARVKQMVFSTKEEAEKVHARLLPQEITTKEQQLTFNELKIEAIPNPWKETGLDGQHFKVAKVSQDQTGMPVTSIEFTNEGAKMFEELTERLVGKPMAIFVGGDLISAPVIQEKISGGSAQISFGSSGYQDSLKEAIDLSRDLNAGAIPAPVVLDGELKIAPSLGVKALEKSIKAGLLGLVFLCIWLIFSYRLLGVFAVLSLVIYATLLIALLKFSSLFVLTLAGVTGIILSIGMAVDANVLIFERMREELRAGKNFSASLAIGFERAWTSIRDANLTTLIVCGILYVLGTSVIKGFAVMLSVGILLSMFTALTITRVLLKTLIGTKVSRKKNIITKL
jgi:protein-export membrane protein SecD